MRELYSNDREVVTNIEGDLVLHDPKESLEDRLTSSLASKRLYYSGQMNFVATQEQVNRGLNDNNNAVRAAWAARRDYTPDQAQIEKIIDSGNASVHALVNRPDIKLTNKQYHLVMQELDIMSASWNGIDDLKRSLLARHVIPDIEDTPVHSRRCL